MRVATYNVNGINGRLPVLLRWLKATSPDIVCLQELKAPEEKFPLQAIEQAGYNAIWHGQKSWNGVAILAKGLQIKEMRRVLPGHPDDTHSRYMEALIGEMVIACLYLPNGNPAPGPKFDYKMDWFKRLSAHAKKLLKHDVPVMLCGDFNVIPTELDAQNPKHWIKNALYFPEPRAAYQKLLGQGWTDAVRSLYPDQKIFTFWEYFYNSFARDAGIRIDHFLLSPHLAKRLTKAGVDREVRGWGKTSDHAPVWIELT
jgi:exodeoxyribonuclease-3